MGLIQFHRPYSFENRGPTRTFKVPHLMVIWWSHCVDERVQRRFFRAGGDCRWLVLHWHRLAIYVQTHHDSEKPHAHRYAGPRGIGRSGRRLSGVPGSKERVPAA